MDFAAKLVDKMTEWVDRAFGSFEFYSSNWGKYLVYGFLIFLGSKLIKFNIKLGKR